MLGRAARGAAPLLLPLTPCGLLKLRTGGDAGPGRGAELVGRLLGPGTGILLVVVVVVVMGRVAMGAARACCSLLGELPLGTAFLSQV